MKGRPNKKLAMVFLEWANPPSQAHKNLPEKSNGLQMHQNIFQNQFFLDMH